MAETIVCPKCKCEIEVTEVMSRQLRAKLQAEFDAAVRQKEDEFNQREAKLREQQAKLQQAQAAIEEEVAARLKAGQERLRAELVAKVREEMAVDLASQQAELEEVRGKLKQAQEQELQLRKQRRELEEEKAALELAVSRRVDEELAKVREAARKEALEERRLKEAEKDELISALRRQIEELKLKSEQGSQQLQGEVLELDLEESLRRAFPLDDILAVSKGVHGADVSHLVRDRVVGECGSILWESKRTKNWNDGWLPKLRDDQRAAKAHVAILVSDQLPGGVQSFALLDGVWVTNRACAIGLAAALRSGLVQVAAARRALEGQQGKMEILYRYLSSDQFKHRIEGIIEPFMTLREQLEAEKRSTCTNWAKREKQIERALASTCGLYGDLGGIIGQSLPAIEHLAPDDLPLAAADGQPAARRIEKAPAARG